MDLKKSQVRLGFIVAMLAIAFLIVKPFLISIMLSAIIAYLLWPLHRRLKKVVNEYTSALLLTIISVSILGIAVYYGINLLLEESANFYLVLSKLNLQYLGPTAQDLGRMFTTKLINSISEQIKTVAHFFISLMIFLVSLFYFLKEGDNIFEKVSKALPFEKEHREKIVKNITQYLDEFVHVQIVIGIIEGILAAVVFYILGLPYVLLAGVAAGILSIIPGLGPALMYIPVGIFMYSTYGLQTTAILIAYGLIVGFVMDYVFRPVFYGKRVKLHPLITFLGIFGGIEMFGFIGIIIGPIILSIALALFKELNIE
ncbi:AI-2E family transporter [Candidatus Woesearchaeota archaeon]|jgi:predicted PurR-regulated permease PerM|nr:AI-2E family transporter [Candidatus Woesearchaeota archaeon]MBT4114663.1 AI-2E family transporter [Candidatus Woesearchaeota archaeon]MBT4248353.1 AI-2E family transporter [Candidatus Woesearchaeota archaeon]